MKLSRLLLICSVLTPLASLPALAQVDTPNQAIMERLDRMDHDIMLMQRQVAVGGSQGSTATVAGRDTVAPADAASLEVRLTAIEEEIRNLQGKIEENQFQNKKTADSLDKLQRDVDFRFNELASNPSAAKPAAAEAKPEAAAKPADGTVLDKPKNLAATTNPDEGEKAAAAAPAAEAKTDQPEKKTAPTSFATPREHYNYAFRLLNQTQYDEAAASFASFIKKYPKDPLVGNAYYWQGETYYIRRDYVNAADSFRQGFETMPNGPKAADNLLKLALSLDAMKRSKEACIVLGQISAKFKTSGSTAVTKAEQEKKRIGCK